MNARKQRVFTRLYGIRFDTTPAESRLISRIAARASAVAKKDGWEYARLDAERDLTACHCNGCPLRLAELAKEDSSTFGHDVFGIRKYLDRRTGKLTDFFNPRLSLSMAGITTSRKRAG